MRALYEKLLPLLVVIALAGLAAPARAAPDLWQSSPGGYEPTGIPLAAAGIHPPLNHLNLRLPARPPDALAGLFAPGAGLSPELATPTDVPSEIGLLAAGLDNDPKLIFDYVHNNYDTITSWGLLRGPVELIQAKAGNPFDQSFLLASLLAAAGCEVHFVFGTIRMPITEAKNWTGVVNEAVVRYPFNAGGVAAAVAGSDLRLNHVWLKVKVGDAWYPLDPSFKSYQSTAGTNLAAALGYSKGDYVTAAQSGSTITANYVQKINESQLQSKLQGYALNLLNAIRAAGPAQRLDQVAGGRSIVPQTTTSLPTQLPYTVESVAGELTGIPGDWVFKLRVQAGGIDQVVPYYSIANQRLTYFYTPATAADAQKIQQAGGIYNVYPAYGVNMKPELRLGGTLLATGSALVLGGYQQVTFTLQTAWKDQNNNRIDIGFSRNFFSSNWYALALRNGDMSDAALSRCGEGLGEQIMGGAAANSEALLGQSLHCLGMAMHSEYGHLRRLAAQLAGVIDALNTGAMVVGQTSLVQYETSGQQRPLRVSMGSYYVDAQLNLGGVVSVDGDANRERGYSSQIAWAYSSTEGAIMEQLQGNPGLSTVRVMDEANRAGQKLYHLTKSNVAGILATLQYPSYIENSLNADVQNGYEVIVPEKNVTVNQWTGTAWYSYDPQSGSMGTWLNGSVGGPPSDEKPVQSISGGSGSLKGLFDSLEYVDLQTASDEEVKQAADANLSWQEKIDLQFKTWEWEKEWQAKRTQGQRYGGVDTWTTKDEYIAGKLRELLTERREEVLEKQRMQHGKELGIRQAEPVDLVSGEYLYDRTDLAFGSLGPGIAFARHYASGQRYRDGPLGRGWTHTYMQRLDRASVWVRTLSDQPALLAAAAVAGLYVGLDVTTTAPAALPFAYLVVGSETTDWTSGRGVNNARVLLRADGAQDRYVRLPDDTYLVAGPGYGRLSLDGQGKATLRLREGSEMRFDAAGRLTALADRNGNATTVTYDGQGLPSQVTDAAGRSLTFAYTGGRLTQLTVLGGALYRYTFDAAGRLATHTDPLGRILRYEYDAGARMTGHFNVTGERVMTNTYDVLGRVAEQTTSAGLMATFRYGDGRNTMVRGAGGQVVVTHNRQGWATAVADGLGNSSRTQYDALGRPLRVLDERGQAWTFTYDAWGNIMSSSGPYSRTWTWTYDAGDNVLTETDAGGRTTRFEYDAKGNLLRLTNPAGYSAALAYDPRGQVTSLTDPEGQATALQYDNQGNFTKVTDPLGHATAITYDALGRPAKITDANGHGTSFAHDAAGDLTEIKDALDGKATFAYRDRNSVASITDSGERTTSFEYNPLGALTKVTDAKGGITRYSYDSWNRLTGKIGADGGNWSYSYDAASRHISTTGPGGDVTQYGYDPAGAVTSVAKPDGTTTSYTYDLAGRITGIVYGDATLTYGYDAAGDLVSATEPGRQVTFTRDALGRVASVSYQAPEYQLAYSYDKAGRRTGLTMTSGGQPVSRYVYTYDAAGRLIRLADTAAGLAVDYAYDAAGNLLSTIFPGAQVTYQLDALNRVSRAAGSGAGGFAAFDLSYTYNPAGNLSGRVNSGPGGLTESFTYTPLDELASVSGPRSSTSYQYDAAGNRRTLTTPGGTVAYTYGAAGQLTSAGSVTYAYDAAGRRTGKTDSRGTTSYTYGRGDRLLTVQLPWGDLWRYRYDYAGRLVQSEGPAGITRFAYDGANLIAEQDAQGRWVTTYGFGAGGLAIRSRPGLQGGRQFTAYLADGRGNVLALADAAGKLRDVYRDDPFGVQGRGAGSDPNPYRFRGAEGSRSDLAGGLLLMGDRWYEPASGLFLTRDPLPGTATAPITAHPYLYARGNPLRYTDPLGLQATAETAVTRNPDGSYTITGSGQQIDLPPGSLDTANTNQAIQATGSCG